MGSLMRRTGPSTLDAIAAPTVHSAAPVPAAPSAAEARTAYAKQLADVPELAAYGPVANSSSKLVQLTEPETEYQVSCVKHIFKDHVVFQVSTVDDGMLDSLTR
jgi:coatomer protein complex subunit gamma